MDWIQLHLALNHIPVIGIPVLVLLLLAAWWRKRQETIRFLLWALMWLALAAIAIKFTGDFAAEQSPEKFAQVKEFITPHEEAADQATTAVFFLAIAIASTLFLSRGGKPFRRWTVEVVLLLGFAAILLYARSAHTGGQISHPELRLQNGK